MTVAKPKVAVLAALPEESAPLARALRGRTVRESDGPCEWLRGRLGASDVLLMHTGEGRVAATEGAQRLTAEIGGEHGWTALLIGVAGALSPSLRVGDIVWFAYIGRLRDEELAGRLAASGKGRGALLTAPTILASPTQKARIWASVGRPEPAAVDMESFFWARELERAGVPWRAVRAISDTSSDRLPEWLTQCVTADGRIDRRRVLRRAMLAPRHLPALLGLRSRLRVATRTLAAEVTATVGACHE